MGDRSRRIQTNNAYRMHPYAMSECIGDIAAAPVSSSKARKSQVISSVAQVDEMCQLVHDAQGKRAQTGDVGQITQIQLSEALLQQQQQPSERFPVALFQVLSAASVMHSLQKLDLSYNNLHDVFWRSEWPSGGGHWTALTSVNFANNMYIVTVELLLSISVLCIDH